MKPGATLSIGAPFGFTNLERTVVESFDANAAFVHGVVVEAAERDEVGGFRFAAIGPMIDVMCIDVASVRAARKAAALVAGVQDAS